MVYVKDNASFFQKGRMDGIACACAAARKETLQTIPYFTMIIGMNTDGTVMNYDAENDMGIILSHDAAEKKYRFNMAQWTSPAYPPVRGLIVTFEPAGGAAMKIMVIGRSSTIM